MKTEKTYSLDSESIAGISKEIGAFLDKNRAERTIIFRVRILVEELLMTMLKWMENSGGLKLRLLLWKRIGRLWIAVEYGGKKFNPTDREFTDSFFDTTLERIGIKPVWTYFRAVNRITLSIPSTGDRQELYFVGAVLLALAAGLLGGVIPENVRTFLSAYILNPVSDLFFKFLSIIAPVLIFLGLLLALIEKREADTQNYRKYIIRRYTAASIVLTVLSTAALIPFFRFQFGAGSGSMASSIDTLYQMILDLAPGNAIQPFASGNMPQIMILAVLFGLAVRGLDNRVDRLSTTIDDLYAVLLREVEYSCKLLPAFIFVSLTSLLWTNGATIVTQLWKPILALAAVYLLLILLYVLAVAVRYRASVFVLIRKILPSSLIGLSTASSMAAFGKINEVNDTLGISRKYADFSVPIGMQLYCGAAAPIFIAIAYYLAEVFQVPADPFWFVIAGIISLIVSIATPPVSGATLICLNILMTSLGIPNEGLAVASTLALVYDFISTGSYIAMRHMEMVLQAGRLKMLDVDKLRSER